MAVAVENIRRQPVSDRECGFYALQNLYVWAGLEPPPVGLMVRTANQLYTTSPEYIGLHTVEMAALLGSLRFPLLFAVACLPFNASAREIFPRFLDQGCAILMGYHFNHGGRRYGHAAVAESWSEAGLEVLCSSDAQYQDSVVQWETSEPLSPDTELPHGNRNIVPWRTQEYSDWAINPRWPVGIQRDFIPVWSL